MAKSKAKLAKLAEELNTTEVPAKGQSVDLLPVSYDRFQARWSLDQDTLERGREAADQIPGEAYLVLRAYSLPPGAGERELSSIWHDFTITGVENSGYFDLPAPTGQINAAVGLVNKSGRFIPLARGKSVLLPAPPTEKKKQEKAVSGSKPEKTNTTASAKKPASPQTRAETLNEAEISARLALLRGLPASFKKRAKAVPRAKPQAEQAKMVEPADTGNRPERSPRATPLDQDAVLNKVRHRLAANPEPSVDTVDAGQALPASSDPVKPGASEQLASQWEDLWSGKAPVKICATFILTGRIAPGMKLLLGHRIVEPAPGGSFVWKQKLESFDQAWPLLRAALETPNVPAGPSLEFFKEVDPSQHMLELQAALDLEGRVSSPDYAMFVPDALQLDEDGHFKLSRVLPRGAVILPGLSLVAG